MNIRIENDVWIMKQDDGTEIRGTQEQILNLTTKPQIPPPPTYKEDKQNTKIPTIFSTQQPNPQREISLSELSKAARLGIIMGYVSMVTCIIILLGLMLT
jgi:hypothetical protein